MKCAGGSRFAPFVSRSADFVEIKRVFEATVGIINQDIFKRSTTGTIAKETKLSDKAAASAV